jgi:hypothetical protein
VDDSTRGKLVGALTERLRRLLSEGHRDAALVAIHALDQIAKLPQRTVKTVPDLALLRAARGGQRDGSE